jgi:hypothetical protein
MNSKEFLNNLALLYESMGYYEKGSVAKNSKKDVTL